MVLLPLENRAMETVQSFNSDSRLDRRAKCKKLEITSNKEKGLIKVNGNGIIVLIQDTSISSCIVDPDGRLVINTNGGKKIIFKTSAINGTAGLIERLNKVLENSNCSLRFNEQSGWKFNQAFNEIDNGIFQINKPLIAFLLVMASLLTFFINKGGNTVKQETVKTTPNAPALEEDAWEARLRRDKEEWIKKQEKENISQQVLPATQNADAKIASIIVTVTCAGNKGLIPRSQMGPTMKRMFRDERINSTDVYENWDYYWGIAKEMDTVSKFHCIK